MPCDAAGVAICLKHRRGGFDSRAGHFSGRSQAARQPSDTRSEVGSTPAGPTPFAQKAPRHSCRRAFFFSGNRGAVRRFEKKRSRRCLAKIEATWVESPHTCERSARKPIHVPGGTGRDRHRKPPRKQASSHSPHSASAASGSPAVARVANRPGATPNSSTRFQTTGPERPRPAHHQFAAGPRPSAAAWTAWRGAAATPAAAVRRFPWRTIPGLWPAAPRRDNWSTHPGSDRSEDACKGSLAGRSKGQATRGPDPR
jgi:hypothetical protein